MLEHAELTWRGRPPRVVENTVLGGGTYAYTWDAESRLIQVVTKRAGDPVNDDKKVEFKYDYMGR